MCALVCMLAYLAHVHMLYLHILIHPKPYSSTYDILFFFNLGFDFLLQQLNDLSLDTPNASEVLGNFIARAIADDCLPPAYVQNHQNVTDAKAMWVHVHYTIYVTIYTYGYKGQSTLLSCRTVYLSCISCFNVYFIHFSEALKRAKVLVSIRHSHAKLENIWGTSGGLQPLVQLADKVK